jgi:hypothetical protein
MLTKSGVKLLRANTTGGYRAYSRNTADNQGAGDWKVELRFLP